MLSRRKFFRLALAVPSIRSAPGFSFRPHVCILTVAVAGYRFHEGHRLEDRLRAGERLLLLREPASQHDSRAVAILHRSRARLGYVSRRVNEIPARLADARLTLFASIREIRALAPPWERLVRYLTELREELL